MIETISVSKPFDEIHATDEGNPQSSIVTLHLFSRKSRDRSPSSLQNLPRCFINDSE